MTSNSLTFPNNLEYTLKRKTKNNIDATCFGISIIKSDIFSLSFVEPFKIVFTNKRKGRHLICFMLQQQVNGRNKLLSYFFIKFLLSTVRMKLRFLFIFKLITLYYISTTYSIYEKYLRLFALY